MEACIEWQGNLEASPDAKHVKADWNKAEAALRKMGMISVKEFDKSSMVALATDELEVEKETSDFRIENIKGLAEGSHQNVRVMSREDLADFSL